MKVNELSPKKLLFSHLAFLEHGSLAHPENALRLEAILAALEASPYKELLDLSITRFATKEELCRVHSAAYVDHVESLKWQNASLDDETILTPGSVNAALLAAGLGLDVVEQVLEGKIPHGFALLRPPGHHARPDVGMGFCVFNNIAIAAKMALAKGIKRILILDWDVHHGNGTQEIFYEDNRVLFIDFHQENLFPKDSGLIHEVGKGTGLGYTVNIPFPESHRDDDYLYAFEKIVKPLAVDYQPELILVSAGFDAHETDPLGSMGITTQGFGLLAAQIKAVAKEICQGKVVFFLEGGYEPANLAKNVLSCIEGFMQVSSLPESDNTLSVPYSSDVVQLIEEVYENHSKQRSHGIAE